MTNTTDNPTGQPNFAAGPAKETLRDRWPGNDGPAAPLAPSAPIFPSRCDDTDETDAKIDRVRTYGLGDIRVETGGRTIPKAWDQGRDMGVGSMSEAMHGACEPDPGPRAVFGKAIDRAANALRKEGAAIREVLDSETVAALTIKLADVEEQASRSESAVVRLTAERDELAAKVLALSEPRVFNAAGLIEQDLAERYESLRGSYAAVEIERDTARDAACLFRDTLDDLRRYLSKEERFGPTIKIIEATLTSVPYPEGRFAKLVRRIADWTDAEVERVSPAQLRRVARAVADGTDAEYPPFEDHALPDKPRCRVVTSPRFYGEVDRQEAANVLISTFDGPLASIDPNIRQSRARIVDAVAKALGMRRAPK